jgi:hypothetical protein
MGIWIELGVFLLALAWGLWQLHDLKQERRKREQRQREEAAAAASLAANPAAPPAAAPAAAPAAPIDAEGQPATTAGSPKPPSPDA